MENVLSLIFFVLAIIIMGGVNFLVYFEKDEEFVGLIAFFVLAFSAAATILHSCAIHGFDAIVGIGIVNSCVSLASVISSSGAALNYDANKDFYLVTTAIFYVLSVILVCLTAVSLAQ